MRCPLLTPTPRSLQRLACSQQGLQVAGSHTLPRSLNALPGVLQKTKAALSLRASRDLDPAALTWIPVASAAPRRPHPPHSPLWRTPSGSPLWPPFSLPQLVQAPSLPVARPSVQLGFLRPFYFLGPSARPDWGWGQHAGGMGVLPRPGSEAWLASLPLAAGSLNSLLLMCLQLLLWVGCGVGDEGTMDPAWGRGGAVGMVPGALPVAAHPDWLCPTRTPSWAPGGRGVPSGVGKAGRAGWPQVWVLGHGLAP